MYSIKDDEIESGQNLIIKVRHAIKEGNMMVAFQMLNKINDIFLNAKKV